MVYQVSLHFQLVSVFATEVKSDSINSILENMDFLRSQLTSGITDEVQKALVTIQGHPVQFFIKKKKKKGYSSYQRTNSCFSGLASKPPPAPSMKGTFIDEPIFHHKNNGVFDILPLETDSNDRFRIGG